MKFILNTHHKYKQISGQKKKKNCPNQVFSQKKKKMSQNSSASHHHQFRLLPELDGMFKEISDLELEQTRVEAARARDARKETALRAIARAEAAAQQSHDQEIKNQNHKTPQEIEEERLAALRCAATAGDAFNATFEAAWTTQQLKDLLDKEESIAREAQDLSAEALRFAHFSELGAVASPVARAAIYHLWDLDALNQPCRCASCGVILFLKKQYIGDKLVEVFCAKCTTEHHRHQLYRENLELQEFYLKKTFKRIDNHFLEDLRLVCESEEPSERRLVEVEQELQWKLIVQDQFILKETIRNKHLLVNAFEEKKKSAERNFWQDAEEEEVQQKEKHAANIIPVSEKQKLTMQQEAGQLKEWTALRERVRARQKASVGVM